MARGRSSCCYSIRQYMLRTVGKIAAECAQCDVATVTKIRHNVNSRHSTLYRITGEVVEPL